MNRRGGTRDVEDVVSTATFAAVFFFIALPLGYLFYGSLRSDAPGVPGAHFTFGNWIEVYTSGPYLIALARTILLSATVAGLSVGMGGILAWIVARTNAPGRKVLATLCVVPLMISSLVTTLAWVALCAPNAGFINTLARSYLGIRTFFDIYSFSGIVLVLTLHFSSFSFIPIYAALRSMDASLEEASYMLGAGPVRTAFQMTLALIRPVLASTFLLVFIFVAENFAAPSLLGSSSGFTTLSTLIFQDVSIEPSQPGAGAAAGTLLLWIALAGTVWQRKITAQSSRYVTIGGKGTRRRIANLGPWKYAATSLVVFYLALAVVLPYCALLLASFMRFLTPALTPQLFTTTNYTTFFTADRLRPITNTLMLSVFGGLFGTIFYLFIAYLIRRSQSWVGKVMDYAVMIPTVTPALVLGVGFIWAFVNLPIPIYGTIWILLLGYLVRFAGQGVRQSRAALVQVSGELTEAARVGGATPLRAFKDILLPILRPSLISMWTLLFILIFLELSITIVLYSPASSTLSVLLWQRMTGGSQTQAFALAVLQATIVFIVLAFSNRLFGTLRSALDD